MAQDPFLVDQIQIEPGESGTRLIYRATDGSIAFKDSILTGGITVSQLAGLRSVANTLVVGKSGAGAEYTTIQSALDAVPASCSLTNPYFVIVMPGVYAETLNIARECVFLQGFGATLAAEETTPNGPGAYHTMVIQAALGTIPKLVVLQNLTVTNIHDNYACVRVVGGAASEVASSGILLRDVGLSATGAGGNHPIWASSVNYIQMTGGYMTSAGLGLARFDNCASVILDTPTMTALDFDYDTTGDEPSVSPLGYRVQGGKIETSLATALDVDLSGDGAFEGYGLRVDGDTSILGDQSVSLYNAVLGDLTIGESVAVTLKNSARGSLSAGGTATLDETRLFGTAAFTAQSTQTVTFDAPMSDSIYTVSMELDDAPANEEQPYITGKTAAGFTINFTSAQTLGMSWMAMRN